MEKNKLSLSRLPVSFKVLIVCFLVTLSLGYLVALLRVFDVTHFDLSETLLHYRGSEVEGEEGIFLPPSFSTLLSNTHVHSFSQPVMLGLVGFLFACAAISEKAKIIFIFLSFLGSVLSNATPWLIRYLSPAWSIFMPVSQMFMALSFFVMVGVTLSALCSKNESHDWNA